ncbi:sterol desaturase family protein [Methylomagnum ishizawai]|uniref:sterol desaturase family protein n=1 Tax=Methylomagnum ishizawai TaxID=1760988 RepID=UPI001C336A02|nr:sterol desaturase family protein [Methylomagnum ishizawai]BBL75897.1 hypothetical protein MishRS11D_29950 [Methylomagnum ishizawai]
MEDLSLDMIGFVAGLLAENAGEWALHKFILHGLGRAPDSIWHYHWCDHHRLSRRHAMLDPGYQTSPLHWNTHGKEVLLLLAIALPHLPLLAVAPGYVAGVYCALVAYYLRHRRAHRDPEWARRYLPWHWEHHLGTNPEANFCTTWPGCDWLMGTWKRTGISPSPPPTDHRYP